MYCLRPKITQVPEGDWFCPTCVAQVRTCPVILDWETTLKGKLRMFDNVWAIVSLQNVFSASFVHHLSLFTYFLSRRMNVIHHARPRSGPGWKRGGMKMIALKMKRRRRRQQQRDVVLAWQRGTKKLQHPPLPLVTLEKEERLNVVAWPPATSRTSHSASESCFHTQSTVK